MTHRPPNILFIMADQYRHDYLGCAQTPGLGALKTPNLDRIAARGTRFTHCCTNSPVCAPARVALACGLQPQRVGALDNNCFLPADVPTYYQRLRDAGYRVNSCGKLDLAKPISFNGRRGDRPLNYTWGFTDPIEIEGKMHAGNHPTPQGPYGFWLQEQGLYDAFHHDYTQRKKDWVRQMHDSVLPTEAFADCYIGRRAGEWITNVSDETPWHAFVSFVGPHDPFDPPTEYAEMYRHAPMPTPLPFNAEGKPARIRERAKHLTAAEKTMAQRQYCAAIQAIDVGVGRILAALAARGGQENTYIVFASDHGEMLGDLDLYTKHVPYEGALRVPLIVAGPGIAAGRVHDTLVELIDVNATICDWAGLPAQAGIDAQSLGPVLRGETTSHREDVVTIERPYRAIRDARWKYIETYNDTAELYDLAADPGEQHNVIAEQPGEARRLARRMTARMA